MNIQLEIGEPALRDLMAGRSGAVQGVDSRGNRYALRLKGVTQTKAADRSTDYLAKATAATDPDLRRGYLALAAADSNPVLPMLENLSDQQLRDVLAAVLELLPDDDDDGSTGASDDSTLYERT